MQNDLKYEKFVNINLQDSFFNSLKSDYPGFDKWYVSKQDKGEYAYVKYKADGMIEGFLYIKNDGDVVEDVYPILKGNKILKIGTFKINPHKTRLGERFIKIALDHAFSEGYEMCYVTIFSKHKGLINLFEKYGFEKEGTKKSGENIENVYVKRFSKLKNDICKDYPLINKKNVKKYILAIYPKYHTVMFPDSKLCTEKNLVIKDISHTNSIHKVYVCTMGVEKLRKGDIVVLYRTASGSSAEYSSIVTTICVVEEVKKQSEFKNFEDFYNYASSYSVFEREDLYYWYRRGACKAVKMLYNIALPKRIVRHDLINNIGLDRNEYWGFFQLSDDQFDAILKRSQTNLDYFI